MKYNILLVVNDCLRYDRVTDRYMPFLAEFGRQNTTFTNFWSVSHCTDPAMTALLSGKWPDELRLYSMMYEHKDYSISDDVEMLAQTAKKHGYTTAMLSNLGRWYKRGVDHYVDSRNWNNSNIFAHAKQWLGLLPEPWFITVHDDSCHTNYRDGSYDAACAAVDLDLSLLLTTVTTDDRFTDNTFIFVTSDHGEGLGERGIDQHGFGLWPFLTHVPLLVYVPFPYEVVGANKVKQHTTLHMGMRDIIRGNVLFQPMTNGYAHMVARTPAWWHRAVTDGETLVIKEQAADSDKLEFTELNLELNKPITYHMVGHKHELWNRARAHALRFGIDADYDKLPDEKMEERLRQLGYFE